MRLKRFGVGAAVVALIGTTLVGTSVGAPPALAAAAAPTVSRLAGADRIGTAVQISQHAFPSAFATGGSVYLARMDLFADAVAAGTLTDGPVLLVPSCSAVPQMVKDEVTRLSPARVVALGGTGAVCDQVLSDAAAGRNTARLAGVDRYLTSLEIARERARQGAVTEVYVASGLDSPDAVVGGQLTRGPILLTGTVDRSADYKAFISEVKPARVVALGGLGAVTSEQLSAIWGWPTARLEGRTRYETAAAIAMREFTADADAVYLARGDVFADAVAAGALKDGPVVLVDSCSLPAAARERIAAARPLRIIALGGPSAVCDAVLSQAAAAKAASGGRIVASQTDATSWASDRESVNAVSSDGNWLLVSGYGLIPDTSFSVALKHRTTGAIKVVAGAGTNYAVDTDGVRALSADGGKVVFVTRTPVDAADTNGQEDVVVFDRTSGGWTVVSRTPAGQTGNGPSTDPVISDDGTTVAFTSAASDLVAGDTNARSDVFASQLSTAKVTLVSRTTEGAPGNDGSAHAAVSGDGRYVVYSTVADNLFAGDVAGTRDLVRTEVVTGTSVRVNRVPACAWCLWPRPSVSADGTVVAYTWPGDEVPGIDAQAAENVFVRDLVTGDLRLASFADGTESWSRSGHSPAISADGTTVAFLTSARLDGLDAQDDPSLYLYDRATRKVTWLSRPFTGGYTTSPASRIVWPPTITADGSAISLVTDQPQLVSYDSTNIEAYLWERVAPR